MASEKSRPVRLAASRAVGAVWWYFLIRGLLLLGAGIFVLLKPGLTTIAFAKLIGFLVLVDGVLAVVAGLMGRAESRFWSILRGVLMLVAGLFVFLQPALVASIAVKTVFYVVGPFVILSGVFEIVSAVRARREKRAGEGSILSGLLTAVFGLLLILAPIFFGTVLLQVIAVVAIAFSLLLLFLAFKFRRLGQTLERAAIENA